MSFIIVTKAGYVAELFFECNIRIKRVILIIEN